MKNFISAFYICFTIIVTSCQSKVTDTSQLEQKIINTDKAMSELAVKEGFFNAILFYADDDIVKFNEGSYPVIGKKEFEELFKDNAGPKTLTWEPVKAEVARSGELGYTWGTGSLNKKIQLTMAIILLSGNYTKMDHGKSLWMGEILLHRPNDF